jgi:hypothetical protein
MSRQSESTAVTTREETSGELAVSAQQALSMYEIQGALTLAKKFPRDEDRAYQMMLKAAKRLGFAEEAQYAFPRGNTVVKGPSIHLAREFARTWGNIRHGVHIVHDDEHKRTIRAFAWDLETGAWVDADDSFGKKVFRRGPNGKPGTWIDCDERELRELTNRRAAIAKRNCILELIPSDMIDDICRECDATQEAGVDDDPDAARKGILKAFAPLGITAEDLRAYLKTDVGKASSAQLVQLRKIYKSIRDGQSTWADYVTPTAAADAGGPPVGRQKVRPEKAEAPKPPAEEYSLTKLQASISNCKSGDLLGHYPRRA